METVFRYPRFASDIVNLNVDDEPYKMMADMDN